MEITDLYPDITLFGLGWERSVSDRILPTFPRDYFRIHFIVNGRGYYRAGKETIVLNKGDGFVIFPGENPSYYPDSEHPWEYFWIAISGESIRNLVAEANLARGAPAFHARIPMDDMRRLLADICATSIIPLSVDLVFPYYLRDFFRSIVAAAEHPVALPCLEQCLEYIADHYADQITVQKIADRVNIDRTYLYKLFMKHLNISPQDYLISYRIQKACELLKTTQESVTEIAYCVGFREYSDFFRQFKKYKNISPSQFRERLGQNSGVDRHVCK